MSRIAIVAGLMVAGVAAQAEFAAPGFKYIGCVEADPPVFSFNVDLPAAFSAQQCQAACHAKGKYAALDSACHCDDSSSKVEPFYKIVHESICSLPCISGNSTAGVCGGPQCSVTGKKRYSLYKKEKDHRYEDDCEKEDKSKGIGLGPKTKYIPTTVKTITFCPPEVTNCPLSPVKVTLPCLEEGCHVLTTAHVEPPPPVTKHHAISSAEPAVPPCPEKCGPPCPPQGCALCPPGGCLPPCPPGCPFPPPLPPPPPPPPPPVCPGEHCKANIPASSACPSGGCIKIVTDPIPTHPHPTHDPVPTKVPVTISEGARYQSGVLIAITALAMAVIWL